MAEQSAQQEPSMEEILASIRRIISEDAEDEAAGAEPEAVQEVAAVPDPEPAAEPEPEPAAEPEAEPETVAAVEAEPEPDPAPDPQPEPQAESEPEEDAPVTDTVPEPAIEVAAMEEDGDDVLELTNVVPAPGGADPIVSHVTEEATSQHLAALSGLLVRSYPGSENTLEGLVREMLKPMLQQWLDQNLPQLVETLVNREIARIAGRDK